MKDFVKVFVMLVIVMAFMAGTAYLGFVLGQTGMAILSAVIAVVVIVLVIKNFDKWFGRYR